MKVSIGKDFEKREDADLLILPFWEGPKAAFSKAKDKREVPCDFKGKKGEVLFVYPAKEREKRFLFLGLGKKEDSNPEELRRAFAAAIKAAIQKKAKEIHVLFPQTKWSLAVLEGIFLTNYSFSKFKSEKLALLEKVVFFELDSKWESEIAKLQKIVSSVHLVRDLVNGNADEITPEELVKEAKGCASKKLFVKALSKRELEKEGMGLLLAVGQGSSHDPFLVQMSYQGNPRSKEHLLLVGKGITYDTGGLCLKPPDNMMTMKADMAGAATILGTMKAVNLLGLKINVTALLSIAENAIGSKSYKLGDIYRSASGKTVEILNTDAEGRLVLADAIAYGVKHVRPTSILDLATLTGSIIVALGEEVAGLFSNHDLLAKALEKASEITGENLWRMPLYDYKESLRSEIADLVNVGGRDAGAMKAALFLQEFTDGIPWAHIDMAGPAFFSKPKYYSPTKATGWGVRLLLAFFELWAKRR